MPRGVEGNEIATPKPPTLRKQTSSSQSSTKGQRSILGFFAKRSDAGSSPATPKSSDATNISPASTKPSFSIRGGRTTAPKTTAELTPVPSSPALNDVDDKTPKAKVQSIGGKNKENGLPSPVTPVGGVCVRKKEADGVGNEEVEGVKSSPSRRAKKSVNYFESGSEGESGDEVFQPVSSSATNARAPKRRKVVEDDSDDEFGIDEATEAAMEAADLDDFIAPDDSEEEIVTTRKRKRPSPKTSSQPAAARSSPPAIDHDDVMDGLVEPGTSTAQQWRFDPDNIEPPTASTTPAPTKKATGEKKKQKAHMSEPEDRYTWLANILDADRNPPGHPEYDPRTLYIPPIAWKKFSPFEKQYWEIKSKLWDTIVFFKKGKFYELYENDATIGHQLFDLKLTDRVNMRMVGVPEASLETWANQFVAKGFKVARVDQMESALGKEMRERDEDAPKKKKDKEDKVIRRELAAVLTAGTLVDGAMLQDDMSTYCVAIKEVDIDNKPAFGIAFVDAATGQFHLAQFTDDAEMTKFETFVAQIRPGELLLEKSCISTKALRILKNNTSPTTLWNYLKPGKEFWAADITCRELDASAYFVKDGHDGHWPQVLEEAKEKELAMSALGALIQYLRTLKIESDLVSLGNFSWYDPIRKASSLVLDGQSLINLEIFANSFDGSTDGTLFSMLNRCVTPFGKRLLRQWVCHPLVDANKINARLDAVDALNADRTVMDSFSQALSKLPDLERLLSRVHSGRCKVQDFLKVLDGFEQIEYTISLLKSFGEGEGLIGQLISSMPDLAVHLNPWKRAFDQEKARKDGIMVPEQGVEEDFDESNETIDRCLGALDDYIKEARDKLKTKSVVYRDIGKELYQMEVPATVKVPGTWSQMSATKQVKRYYTSQLKTLVRELQEAQETHSQIVKEVAGRFYARFDEQYSIWLAAVKIIAQLDCLISLAKASSSLGYPSCRPQFTNSARSILQIEELRHPCMLTNVSDFIPNDISLGGSNRNIDLLTGANAAGKSTVLRMTCIAVILAQIGCYVPASSALLTPVDRIMSRLGANDNIFAAQSTFFVELSETKKILSEATPRSLVILDELGRGTSSYDGVAVAQAVLHHIATHVGCMGFFATHYHSLAAEFSHHPEIRPVRMAIDVDEAERRVTFLYKLEEGVAEGSFGMHCASMCGIPKKVVERAEVAAKEWEHTSRLKESLDKKKGTAYIPLGWLSDLAWLLKDRVVEDEEGQMEKGVEERGLECLMKAVEGL